MGNSVEKSAVASTTLWATLLTFFPLAIQEFPDIVTSLLPVLTPQAAAALSAAAGVLIAVRRIFSANKEIVSILPK